MSERDLHLQTAQTMRSFVLYVADKPGVLDRVASLFRRRAFNIEALTVARTERPGISRMLVEVRATDDEAHRLVANIHKLYDVVSVTDITLDSASGAERRDMLPRGSAERNAR